MAKNNDEITHLSWKGFESTYKRTTNEFSCKINCIDRRTTKLFFSRQWNKKGIFYRRVSSVWKPLKSKGRWKTMNKPISYFYSICIYKTGIFFISSWFYVLNRKYYSKHVSFFFFVKVYEKYTSFWHFENENKLEEDYRTIVPIMYDTRYLENNFSYKMLRYLVEV